MSPNNTIQLDIRLSSAIDASEAAAARVGEPAPRVPQKTITLTPSEPVPRHDAQMLPEEAQKLDADWSVGVEALPFSMPIHSSYQSFETDAGVQMWPTVSGDPIIGNNLYLFNVIIALEWNPSPRTIQQLQVAASRASDVLFDITDGHMAIGQVLIGGPDLMDVADIQVMASNRLHPRSWVDALNVPGKFQPIRVGRGLWRKNRSFVTSWDEPEGYRALAHEWGHYALGLSDEYLVPQYLRRDRVDQRLWEVVEAHIPATLQIVAPNIGLAVESIMSTLDASELVPGGTGTRQQRRNAMFKRLKQRFEKLPEETTILEGPSEVPLDLPVFRKPNADRAGAEEVRLKIDPLLRGLLPALNPRLPGNCWVYVLKQGPNDGDPPSQIIGQGVVVGKQSGDDLLLLGAAAGDTVVITGESNGQLKVFSGKLATDPGPGELWVVNQWEDATPDAQDFPNFVDVLPEPLDEVAPAKRNRSPGTLGAARVQLDTNGRVPEVRLYPFGNLGQYAQGLAAEPALYQQAAYPNRSTRQRYITSAVNLPHLDGHVLLSWPAADPQDNRRLLICSYSHGGGPSSSGGGRLPISAGSAEGNAMVFFSENGKPLERAEDAKDDTRVRVVTTAMHWGDEYLGTAEARSYVFSLASNANLTPYEAAFVLYYDSAVPKHNGSLLIYRWADAGGWQPLTTHAPDNQQYVVIPWNPNARESAERLLTDPEPVATLPAVLPRFERYRIYWTP